MWNWEKKNIYILVVNDRGRKQVIVKCELKWVKNMLLNRYTVPTLDKAFGQHVYYIFCIFQWTRLWNNSKTTRLKHHWITSVPWVDLPPANSLRATLFKLSLSINWIKMAGQATCFPQAPHFFDATFCYHNFINWRKIFSVVLPLENRIKTSTTEGLIVAAIA